MPSRSLLPERFRGPVAPSAAGPTGPTLSREGGFEQSQHARWRPEIQPLIPYLVRNRNDYDTGLSSPHSNFFMRDLPEPLPPSRRQHSPRQRDSPPIHHRPRPTQPRLRNNDALVRHHLGRGPRQTRPQHRSLHRQHPTQRPQNPPCLRRSDQQRHHLRPLQSEPQLRPATRHLPATKPHQPAKPRRPDPSQRRNHLRNRCHPRHPRLAAPKPTRLKPNQQPRDLAGNRAQNLTQQRVQRSTHQLPHTPGPHHAAESKDDGRHVMQRGKRFG